MSGHTRSTVGSGAAALLTIVATITWLTHGARSDERAANARAARITSAPTPDGTALEVPFAKQAITLDGELDDAPWLGAAGRTGAFLQVGGGEPGAAAPPLPEPARPYSEARFGWNDQSLFVALYAADREIRAAAPEPDGPRWKSGDYFELVFHTPDGERLIQLSPDGTVTDARRTEGTSVDFSWQSGIAVAHDIDGTINDPSDEDEEWVLEFSLPLEAVGLAPQPGSSVPLSLKRCDAVGNGTRTCSSWGSLGATTLRLGPR